VVANTFLLFSALLYPPEPSSESIGVRVPAPSAPMEALARSRAMGGPDNTTGAAACGLTARGPVAALHARRRHAPLLPPGATKTPYPPPTRQIATDAPTDVLYDAVIVGGGMGGLTTAAKLVEKGAKVRRAWLRIRSGIEQLCGHEGALGKGARRKKKESGHQRGRMARGRRRGPSRPSRRACVAGAAAGPGPSHASLSLVQPAMPPRLHAAAAAHHAHLAWRPHVPTPRPPPPCLPQPPCLPPAGAGA
jgi:hypothetical protein